jgi:hypothetical protein
LATQPLAVDCPLKNPIVSRATPQIMAVTGCSSVSLTPMLAIATPLSGQTAAVLVRQRASDPGRSHAEKIDQEDQADLSVAQLVWCAY